MRFAWLLSLCSLSALPLLIGGCPESAPAPGPADPTLQGNGSGPLAGLESAPFQNEVWTTEDGQQVPFLFYARENLRVNAQCRGASGQFTCQAISFMRNGTPVEIARRALDGRTSAGVKVCMRMNQPIVIVRNSVGAEDSFCRFPDGSLVSNGALEQYKMRVIQ
ncbi:MAG TPA: hypothetical protein VLT33_23070 [Labilithrix sp.]|nr:hypothetical protein [Labilithrix sp.]